MSVYVGIDVHRKRSQVAVVTEDGKVQLNKNVVNGSEPMLRLIGDLPAGTPVAFEAAFGWGWLVQLLEDYGFEPHLVHPLRCKAIASAAAEERQGPTPRRWPGVDAVRGVDVGALPAPAAGRGGQVGDPQGVAPAVLAASNRDSCAPGCGRSRRAKSRMAFGQPLSWSPAGPSRSSPVSSATCASSIQHSRWAHRWLAAGVIGAALADLALRVDRGLPGGLGDLADRGLLPGVQFPADGVGDLVAVPGREPVQLGDQGMTGAGAGARDHQLAAAAPAAAP